MEAAARPPVSPAKLVVPALIGAAVALGLGIYGHVHDPTGSSILSNGLFFSGTLNMKAWLATAVIVFACVQIFTASWMYGRLPFASIPGWLPTAHRASGLIAFLISLPVVYHCLWALGFQDYSTRVLVHSIAGCFFYGAFVAKMLWVRTSGLPPLVLPIIGGTVFTSLVVIWFTSAFWFFDNIGFPSF
jgi:Family of unknown function (DUF6529)